VDELHSLVQEGMVEAGAAGPDASNLIDGRRAAAAGFTSDRSVAERIATAPPGLVLVQDAAALARQAALLEPRPAVGIIRVAVTPSPGDGSWAIDVAARDRPGLLAAVTGGLARVGLDVADAAVATWGDGGVIETFRVRAPHPPVAAGLNTAIDEALRSNGISSPVPDAVVTFDDAGSPWYTVCSIQAGDRPGLLHDFAQAFASTGVEVHSARISTTSGLVTDVFEVTDGRGRKLGESTKQMVREAVAAGASSRGRRGLRRRARRAARAQMQEI
jgi:UTP:GlnB (protein PII) uridylyltransferase